MAGKGVNSDPLKVGVVDIGSNSMRMLITNGEKDVGRWTEVTGLGKGVDASGRLSEEAMQRTLEVLWRYGRLMDGEGIGRRAAMATSATRDASNREEFRQRATDVLGVEPEVISGEVEGRLAYDGALSDLSGGPDYLVSDIGGGSTEFVTADEVLSIDMGSVRLTDRLLPDRPAEPRALEDARARVRRMFDGMEPDHELVGVAGTWTSLAAIHLELGEYLSDRVHHHRIDREGIDRLTSRLAGLTLEETETISALDPARAPVILAGAVIAGCVMDAVGSNTVLISERDTLDGLARRLLGLP